MRGLMGGVLGGVVVFAGLAGGCATRGDTRMVASNAEIGCGSCRFGMEGTGCDLAVRIQGQTYVVEGASIDDFGDAHAEDGLCVVTRRATVSGRVEGDRFVADSVVLQP